MARSQRYLEHVLKLLEQAKKKGLLTDGDLDRIVRTARGRTGGEVRAERARAASGVAADDYGMAPAYVPVGMPDDDDAPDLDDIADVFGLLEIEGSYQDSIEDVCEALKAAYGDQLVVVATFPDRVVYVTCDPDEPDEFALFSQEYTTDANGAVTLGAKQEVGLEADSFKPQPEDEPALADMPMPPKGLNPKEQATWRKFYANALKTCKDSDKGVCQQKAKAAADKMVGNIKGTDALPVVRFARRVLTAVGLSEPVALADTTEKPWNGSASKYADADAYCKAALIDLNESGKPKTIANCKLPIYEPDGTLNLNAVRNARSRLPQVTGVPAEAKAAAQKQLDALAKKYQIGAGNTKASDWGGQPSAVALADAAPYFTMTAVRLADLGGGTLPDWQQVHRLGEWAIPHASGQQIALTRDMGNTMIRNFRANVIRRGVPLDEIHLTDQGGRALGWLLDLRWGSEGQGLPGLPGPDGAGPILYGRFRYNRLGVEMLSDEHYKYLSPQYHLDYLDKESGDSYGPAIVAVGATNNPFLRQRSIQGEEAPPVAVLQDGLVRPQQPAQEAPMTGQQSGSINLEEEVRKLREERAQDQRTLQEEREERHKERVQLLWDRETSAAEAIEPRYRRLIEPLMLASHPKQTGSIRLADAAADAPPLNVYQLCEQLIRELPRVRTGRVTLADDTRPGPDAGKEKTIDEQLAEGRALAVKYGLTAATNGAVHIPSEE